ncbi:21021_t:CDS:2, partial [Dentiscutata erythropus]
NGRKLPPLIIFKLVKVPCEEFPDDVIVSDIDNEEGDSKNGEDSEEGYGKNNEEDGKDNEIANYDNENNNTNEGLFVYINYYGENENANVIQNWN